MKYLGISLIFLWASLNVLAQPKVADKIIARVDNYIILKSDLELAYQNYISNGSPDTPDTKCFLFRQLIMNKMMVAQAEVDSVIVEKDRIDSELERRMDYFMQQIGSEEKFEKHFGKTVNQMKEELRPDITEQLTTQEMQKHLTKDVKITPHQAKKFFDAIPKDSIPFFPTEVEAGQIVKLPEVSQEIKNQVKADLVALKNKILAGEDFEKLARVNSEDLGTASRGGNLGWFGRGQLAPEYEAMSLSLKEGEIGEPVESEFGFHLIQLLERRGNRFNTRHILIRPKPVKADLARARVFLDSIRTLILSDSIEFEKAASKFSKDKATRMNGGLFKDYENNTTKIFTSSRVLDYVVFKTLDSMKVGNITPPLDFRTEDGKDAVRLLYLKSKTLGHYASMETDFEKIYNFAIGEERNKVIMKWFEKTRKKLFIDIDPDYDYCKIMDNL